MSADLSGADLSVARIHGSYLEGANLEGANLAGAILGHGGVGPGPSLKGAPGTRLKGANLFLANFRDTENPHMADFEGAYMDPELVKYLIYCGVVF